MFSGQQWDAAIFSPSSGGALKLFCVVLIADAVDIKRHASQLSRKGKTQRREFVPHLSLSRRHTSIHYRLVVRAIFVKLASLSLSLSLSFILDRSANCRSGHSIHSHAEREGRLTRRRRKCALTLSLTPSFVSNS